MKSNDYYKAEFSAENRAEADKIFNALLKKKLIAGGLIINGPAQFWWKGEIVGMDYYTISCFTIEKPKASIISEVKQASIEEVPMI